MGSGVEAESSSSWGKGPPVLVLLALCSSFASDAVEATKMTWKETCSREQLESTTCNNCYQ